MGPQHPKLYSLPGCEFPLWRVASGGSFDPSVPSDLIQKTREGRLLKVTVRQKTGCVQLVSTSLIPRKHSTNGICHQGLPPPSVFSLRSQTWDGLWKEIKGTEIKKTTKAHQMALACRTGSQGAIWLRAAEQGRPTALRPALTTVDIARPISVQRGRAGCRPFPE